MLITREWAYYNEIEEYAADWLENLIALGCIAPGVVDRRSIEDVRPDELRGFRQCHFFAGVGVWSYALRCAGVSDDTPLWTGSAPCQPFSAAGKGTGMDDERHLWPHWFYLIGECRPRRVFGEQVASKDGLGWIDLVQADMEAEDYALWAVDTCSAGSGAPHIRQRLRFVSEDLRPPASGVDDGHHQGLEGLGHGHNAAVRQREEPVRPVASASGINWVADSEGERRDRGQDSTWAAGRHRVETSSSVERLADLQCFGQASVQRDRDRYLARGGNDERPWAGPEHGGLFDGLADSETDGRREECSDPRRITFGDSAQGFSAGSSASCGDHRPGPTNGFWRDADWLFGRDGKWRPVESQPQQMAHGTTPDLGQRRSFPLIDGKAFKEGSGHPVFEGKSRAGMLKAYGNAIDAQATIDFIKAYLDRNVIEIDHEPVGGTDDADLFADLFN